MERAGANDTRPRGRCAQQVVDDEAELEEAVLALRPRLLEKLHRFLIGRTRTSCMTVATRRPSTSWMAPLTRPRWPRMATVSWLWRCHWSNLVGRCNQRAWSRLSPVNAPGPDGSG